MLWNCRSRYGNGTEGRRPKEVAWRTEHLGYETWILARSRHSHGTRVWDFWRAVSVPAIFWVLSAPLYLERDVSLSRHKCDRVRINRPPLAIAGFDMATSSSVLVPTTLKSSAMSITH